MTSVALLLTACSSVNGMLGGSSQAKALSQLKWAYAADGLKLVWQADPQLNESEGQPHALALVAVQMEDPATFIAYAGSTDKLAELLAASVPPQGFLALNPVFVQPGTKGSVTLPRMEKAKYVGIVAGYYGFDPARIVRLYQIGVQVQSSGWVVKSRTAAPAPLEITLMLGRDGLAGTGQGVASAPPPLTQPPVAGQVPLPAAAAPPAVVPGAPGVPGASAAAPAAPVVPVTPAPVTPTAEDADEAAVKAGANADAAAQAAPDAGEQADSLPSLPGMPPFGQIPGLGSDAKKALQK
ncbi:type VI secretion lipoprotein TssJ [Paraburkholderia bonniea]|uniref:type VI secretion lipoprotein TssJ n=1 Tax=Paraburkholderia bonniea TaxID=2152891 RepID=UPI00157FEC7E|nr:type VI secretion lipoprotein TssJ [Paraburkholderia bonniea]WJF89267.1 type VI secretion lipoprotein TssJ [Paraburkholderia bonniea]WJF92583.1 type VI secretion lipoprotein TssJ [Paraburkholderia bonniea]